MSFRKALLTALPLLALALVVVAHSSRGSDGAAAGSGRDSDGDGFPDSWETGTTPDGLDMVKLGADPNRADIFLEVDFMRAAFRNSLSCANLNKIYSMFKNAPVNIGVPGVERGINIHIDAKKTCSTRSYALNGSKAAKNPTRFLMSGCDFGTAFNESFRSGRAEMVGKRLNVFHHVFIVDEISSHPDKNCDPLGVARAVPGRQFLVGRREHNGFGPRQSDIRRELAATLAHELGHDLGLTHGGGNDPSTFKPNHLSIMDYWQAGGIFMINGKRRFDYQRWSLAALNELQLNERNGLGKPQATNYRAAYTCGPDFQLSEGANKDIDWNCNGNPRQTNVQANIDGTVAQQHQQTPNEWARLTFGGSVQGGGDIGARSGLRTMSEDVIIPQPGDEFTIDDRPH